MINPESIDSNLIEIFSSLSEIPLRIKDPKDALKRITEFGRLSLNSHTCTLSIADIQTRYFTTIACSSSDQEFEKFIMGKKSKMGTRQEGAFIDFELMASGIGGERYNLQEDGEGLANPHVARRYNLRAVLSYPLRSEDGIILYFNSFSSKQEGFTDAEKKLVRIFCRLALITIELLDYQQTQDRSLRIISHLSQILLLGQVGSFLDEVSAKAAELMCVPICIVWKLEKGAGTLKIVATHGDVDAEYKMQRMDPNGPAVGEQLLNRQVFYVPDISKAAAVSGHHEEAQKRHWVSLLRVSMWVEDELIGMLDVYTQRPRSFKEWEKRILHVFANHAALSIQKADLLREIEKLAALRKVKEDNDVVAEIRDAVDRVTSDNGSTMKGELEKISSVIVRKCATATGASTSFLCLWDKVTEQAELKYLYDTSAEEDQAVSLQVEMSKAVTRYVAGTGKALFCKDPGADDLCAELSGGTEAHSLFCVPIKSGDIVIGTVGISSEKAGLFGLEEKTLLERIASDVSISIERASLADGLLRLAEATVESETLEPLLRQLIELTCDLMREPICLVWLLDRNRNGFVANYITVPEGQQLHAESLYISNDAPGIDQFFLRSDPLYFRDAAHEDLHPYRRRIDTLGWKSMLAMPMTFKDKAQNRRIGILEIYSYKEERNFTDWHRKLFKTLAVQAAIAIENRERRESVEKLNEILQAIEDVRDVEKLLRLILREALKLAGSSRGWISRIDLRTGLLDVKFCEGNPSSLAASLQMGNGISRKALETETPLLVEDGLGAEESDTYAKAWPDTRSQIAVPIIVSNAKVRIGHKTKLMSKPLGLLNIESPTPAAFSETDRTNLWALARQAAIIIDRLELDQKLSKLADIQKHLADRRDWDEILELVPGAITDILGYDYVNISMVELNRIKTVGITGIDQDKIDEFKRMADHPLEGDDIQADIVRTKRIEVPDESDRRFDTLIWERFGHRDLIRVFIPMMAPPDNRVIGTVEAGYHRGRRKFIYEQDVQILKGFLDYAVLSLEPRTRGLVEIISHEFLSSVALIRSNASFLQNRYAQLSNDYIQVKFEDLMLDCEVLRLQAEDLQRTFGHTFVISKKAETVVFRDVIIKTIHQIKPIIRANDLDVSRIEYNPNDSQRIVLFLDKVKLNQVVYNILLNSIKYAESDPDAFKMKISISETRDEFLIRFQDWGIGIANGLEDKIFEQGFRTPEAIRKTAKGMGLGLSIARRVMRDIGGDLTLVRSRKPTEFHLLLPKSLKEVPNDTVC